MITDKQIEDAYWQQYERGVLKHEVRSYEVSLWTLQDDFLTVLKWSDAGQKGQIQNPELILNVDGTEKLSFSIPMYIRTMDYVKNQSTGELEYKQVYKENPSWYTVENGMLILGLRKLKVIFNKLTEDEQVFEFVITNTHENHEGDVLTCEVEAEGLAFQELGKIGYKINLSLESFELAYQEWQENGQWTDNWGNTNYDMPVATVDYWCQNGCGLEPYLGPGYTMMSGQWYYSVEMKYNKFDAVNNTFNEALVYEDPYASNWDDNLRPTNVITLQEKARIIEVENSNLYNITQQIAETFGIFCRYEYIHDDNYHITGRKIVFYNNFMQEDSGTLSFTYPYSTKKTGRTIDSADVTTKLYVLSTDNDTILEGYNSIMNAPANMSGEDYILNFDYLYRTQAISEEQYKAINPYLKEMRELNKQLSYAQQQLSTYEEQLTDWSAKKKVYDNSIDLDSEQILQNQALKNELDSKDGNADGYIELTGSNCDQGIILTDASGAKYVNLRNTNKGIVIESIKMYSTYTAKSLSGEITTFYANTDEYNNAVNLYFTSLSNSITKVYLTYKYDPKLYYDNIVKTWQVKLAKDREEAYKYARLIGPTSATETGYNLEPYPANTTLESAYNQGLNKKITDTKETIQNLIATKNNAVKRFEQLMGPALREGYWQPDDYKNFGDLHEYSSTITSDDITVDTEDGAIVAWDTTLFDGEDTVYFQTGVTQEYEFYPCIDLTQVFPNGIPSNLDTYSLVWKAVYYSDKSYDWNSIKDLLVFGIGSKIMINFIKINDSYKPVLVVTGAKTLNSTQLERMLTSNTGEARLEQYSTTVNSNGTITINHVDTRTIPSNAWILYRNITTKPSTWSDTLWNKYTYLSNVESVCTAFPRIKISSIALKTDTTDLAIRYGNDLLMPFEDYYINTRNTERNNLYFTEYYITLKPASLIKKEYSASKEIGVYYFISNADTAIYLDALQVSKENAYPKVSYEVEVNAIDTSLTRTLYTQLARIIMINDTDLKLDNVFGYISQLTLNLDKPWEDQIEVKDYKNKFEDLFSTIVASTEAMRQNEGKLSSLLNGNSWLNAFNKSKSTLDQYLNNYFNNSITVQQRLQELFTEAGQILTDSGKSLNKTSSLAIENANILSQFAIDISNELTPRVIHSSTRPTKFKVGDIWVQDENTRYVATSNSDDLEGTREVANDTTGFVRTYDGTLASITGAGLNIDTVAGTVDVEAENQINIKSGNNVYIAADERVEIVGNQSVTIGGGTVNIAGASNKINGDATSGWTNGSINLIGTGVSFAKTAAKTAAAQIRDLISGDTSNLISKVLISPTKIEMGASTLELKGASLISLIASSGNMINTSTVQLSADNGIWIGSGKAINLFSGTSTSSSNVQLNADHMLFGFANLNTNNTTAIELTDEFIILAAGTALTGNKTSDRSRLISGTTGSLIGAKFTKESIGFAVLDNNNKISAALIDSNGLTLGSGSVNVTLPTNSLRGLDLQATGGSYVRIASEGIEIGSTGYLYINTNNFLLNSSATGTNSIFALRKLSGTNTFTNFLTYSVDEGLTVHGNIINGPIYLINGQYPVNTNNPTYTTGFYVANSFTGASSTIIKDGVTYYAWYHTATSTIYYCTANSGSTHTIQSGETLYYYKADLKGVAPRHSRAVKETTATNGDYTYPRWYITTDGTNIVKDSSGNDIEYDGSNAKDAAWYVAIPSNLKSTCAYEFRYGEVSLTAVAGSTMAGQVLTHGDYTTVFEINASNGLTKFNIGQLGNVFVTPQGLFNGSFHNSLVTSNSRIEGCSIEGHDTGYYGSCFYDYHMNRDTGILTLIRVNGTSVDIDINTAVKVVVEGGSTGDSSYSGDTGGGSGGDSGGGSGGCSGCDSTCSGGCSTTCTGYCTTSCYSACADSCQRGCGDSCNKGCNIECSVGCSAGCGAACSSSCTGGCSGNCGDACSYTCSNECDNGCGDGCGSDCSGSCTETCADWCYGSCGGGCGSGCSNGCTGSCTNSCYTGCGGVALAPGPQLN